LGDCRANKLFVVYLYHEAWNFKHIVNLARIKGYNAVNLKMGYAPLEIRNSKELINYGTN
jgi:hypothetical protein